MLIPDQSRKILREYLVWACRVAPDEPNPEKEHSFIRSWRERPNRVPHEQADAELLMEAAEAAYRSLAADGLVGGWGGFESKSAMTGVAIKFPDSDELRWQAVRELCDLFDPTYRRTR